MSRYKLSIDIGGTFIDVVAFDVDSKVLKAFKLPTTPHDPAQGVIASIGALDAPAEAISDFIHGTTLGLNAILERKGAKVGIITNEGFRDIFEIARGSLDFVHMYRFDYETPKPLVERHLIRGVPGRMDFEGTEVTPLDETAVIEAARSLHEGHGCAAIAVSFLHAYANSDHEKRAVELIRQHVPGVEVSAGALIANEYREYERTSTAVLDAYIKPVLKNYLGRVSDGLESQGFAGRKYVMNSSGGALTFSLAESEPIATVLSGPAGGVSGALYVARATERPNVLSVDVGGTSLDACLIVGSQPLDVFEASIENFPMLQPIFDLRTLGAGGGSIAWIDNKLLRVGPHSAGAVPGPACYGRGGTDATVTDAAVILGYIDTTNFMGGQMSVATDLATAALKTSIADPLGISVEDAARSMFSVLISRTASSIKEMMLERGLDPSEFAMLGFGGCGPLLAPMLQNELEMPELVIPPLPSVFSAWGMMAGDLTFSDAASVLSVISPDTMIRFRDQADALERSSVTQLREKVGEAVSPEVSFLARIRFVGQEHTLSVPYLRDDSAETFFQRFSQAHLERFGHTFENEAEVVSILARLVVPTEKPDLATPIAPSTTLAASRPHRMFDQASGQMVDCEKVSRDALVPGEARRGPLLVIDEGSSLAIHGNQTLVVDGYGMISVRRVEA
ncbi:hydantoinase/oxoprolinase family protein [Arsenicitalea aurantiaca]|uniref:Hydantoinase/oxoprolinase family protein n=1 Tax=Arsenicitalea aurantiaca TaxID=1783274 RepID=A0A433XEC6_9HYPH|nr:hydantoinase/oxoprolinase family protein [Arsenicitalea aurantiaca]RUT32471.1 hydantoinase/oxoprolinase family protein [Arsenicitalea aurantiaca]